MSALHEFEKYLQDSKLALLFSWKCVINARKFTIVVIIIRFLI